LDFFVKGPKSIVFRGKCEYHFRKSNRTAIGYSFMNSNSDKNVYMMGRLRLLSYYTVWQDIFFFGFVPLVFRFVSKQICLFRLFRNGFETPKQTGKIIYWFRETNRKWTETDCVSVCFGSNRKKDLFVSRTP
jgi:hypothetical protein